MASNLVQPFLLAVLVFGIPGLAFGMAMYLYNPKSEVPKRMATYAVLQTLYPVIFFNAGCWLWPGLLVTDLDNALTLLPKEGFAIVGVVVNVLVVCMQVVELSTMKCCFEHKLILGVSVAASSSHALTHWCTDRFWVDTVGLAFIIFVNLQSVVSVVPFLRAATGEQDAVMLGAALVQRTFHLVGLYVILMWFIPDNLIMYIVLFQSNVPDFVAFSPSCVGEIIRPAVLPPSLAKFMVILTYMAFEMFALASHMRPDLFAPFLPNWICLNDVFDFINPLHWWCVRITSLRWIYGMSDTDNDPRMWSKRKSHSDLFDFMDQIQRWCGKMTSLRWTRGLCNTDDAHRLSRKVR